MSHAIRAVYENGLLRPIDPIDLSEGQQIQLMILSEREQARAALSNILVKFEPNAADDIDEAALFADIDAEMRGKPPISDIIIEERREGP